MPGEQATDGDSEEEQHTKVTLFERENGEPVFKLGEHDDQFRITDGDLEAIEVVEVAELDQPWSMEELNALDCAQNLPEPIREHFETSEVV